MLLFQSGPSARLVRRHALLCWDRVHLDLARDQADSPHLHGGGVRAVGEDGEHLGGSSDVQKTEGGEERGSPGEDVLNGAVYTNILNTTY